MKVTFLFPFGSDKMECEAKPGDTVLKVALSHEVPIYYSCGGMGSCTTCLVRIERGLERLPARNAIEQEHAKDRGFAPEERLACLTPVHDGLVVRLPRIFRDK